MTLSIGIVEGLAPDQASLKAATKQMSAKKWPLRGRNQAAGLIWGECQGSGANPYRVMADVNDAGYKCTCPSRKFPCKHSLALMLMFVEAPDDFAPGETPDWVSDWLGRRRKTGGTPAAAGGGDPSKSLAAARAPAPEAETPVDPKTQARREAQAKKRAADTRAAVAAGLDDLEQWIADQLRLGLNDFLGHLTERCRRAASRLVDAKAAALASRLDELPARLMALPAAERADGAVAEFSRLILLARAWRAAPEDPGIAAFVAAPPGREAVLSAPDGLKIEGVWEVLGERVRTMRDGLVAQTTWLLQLGEEAPEGAPRFAKLLDFFPAAVGRRGGAFSLGDQFWAALAFYPGAAPERALILERRPLENGARAPWPETQEDPLEGRRRALDAAPWLSETPVLLPPGRLASGAGGALWWMAAGGDRVLPLAGSVPPAALGAEFSGLAALWDGARAEPLAGMSRDWGGIGFDG